MLGFIAAALISIFLTLKGFEPRLIEYMRIVGQTYNNTGCVGLTK